MESNDFRNLRADHKPRQSTKFEKKRIRIDKGVTIFRTAKSPCWYVQYNVQNEGQKKVSLGTTDQKTAMQEACRIADEGMHTHMLLGPCTITRAVEEFLDERRGQDRARGTLATYQGQLYQFVEFAKEHGITRLDHVTPSLVRAFVKRLSEEGVLVPDPKNKGKRARKNDLPTVRAKAKIVKGLCRFAYEQKLISTNPLTAYRLPPRDKRKGFAFPADQVDAICNAAGPFFGMVFRFLALTGLRQGELIWLTKGDVSFQGDRAVLHIRAKPGWRPKSRARDVPLSPAATAILKEVLAAFPDSQWVFPAPMDNGVKDDRLRPCRLCYQLKRAKRLTGIKVGRGHSLRHFFITSFANNGMLVPQLSKVAGHSDIRMTMEYYNPQHLDLHEALEKFDLRDLFKSKENEK